MQNLQPFFEVPGHCSQDGYTCQKTVMPNVTGKKIHLFSCQTAIGVGEALYKMGNEFLGYDTDITLAVYLDKYTPCVDTNTSNTTAFTLADLAGTISLQAGNDVKKAYDDTYEAYEKLISYYDNQDTEIAPVVARLLKANELSLVSYPSPSVAVATQNFLIPLVYSIALAALAVSSLVT